MQEEVYNQIVPLAKDLEVMAVHGYDPSPTSSTLLQIDKIGQHLGRKPTDFGCRSCITSLVKEVWNQYKNHK
jgi:hypothetical protein